jgi:peptide/nickel transport system substrate-binding protein
VVLNASQAFFNTKGFTGWPTDDNLYADPLPYLSVAPAIVLLHLKPVS